MSRVSLDRCLDDARVSRRPEVRARETFTNERSWTPGLSSEQSVLAAHGDTMLITVELSPTRRTLGDRHSTRGLDLVLSRAEPLHHARRNSILASGFAKLERDTQESTSVRLFICTRMLPAKSRGRRIALSGRVSEGRGRY